MKTKMTPKQHRRLSAPSPAHQEATLVSKDGESRALCWHTIRRVRNATKVDHSGLDVATWIQGRDTYNGEAKPQDEYLAAVLTWYHDHQDEKWPPYLDDEVLGCIKLKGAPQILNGIESMTLRP